MTISIIIIHNVDLLCLQEVNNTPIQVPLAPYWDIESFIQYQPLYVPSDEQKSIEYVAGLLLTFRRAALHPSDGPGACLQTQTSLHGSPVKGDHHYAVHH